MTTDKAKVLLEYIKVLLAKYGCYDTDLIDALSAGIKALGEGEDELINSLFK